MRNMSNHSIKRGQSKFTCSAERENGRSKTNHKKGRPPPAVATAKYFRPERSKSFAIDPSTDCIVSLAAKAKKVGGLFLALNGAAVRPTDAVDAKKEYALLAMDGSMPVTPVEPEVTPVTPE